MEEMKLYYPHCADISLIERGVLCEGRQPGFNLSNSPGVIARCRQNESQRSRCQEESHVNEGEENFVGDSEIIALGGASNETKDRPLG